MPRAAGWVAHRHAQELVHDESRAVRARGVDRAIHASLDGIVQERIEGRIQNAVDDRGVSVERSGRLTRVAADLHHPRGTSVIGGGQTEFEKKLVDGTEFFGPQMPVVDGAVPVGGRVLDLGQVPDGGEQ